MLRSKMSIKKNWLRLDDENGWQVIIPEIDIKPHGFPKPGVTKAEMAGSDCPCKPNVDWIHQIIIHNSFEEQKKIDDSMDKISTGK